MRGSRNRELDDDDDGRMRLKVGTASQKSPFRVTRSAIGDAGHASGQGGGREIGCFAYVEASSVRNHPNGSTSIAAPPAKM